MLDSGAFTSIFNKGRFDSTPEEYAAMVRGFDGPGAPDVAVSQDLMVESWILDRVGGTVRGHQAQTIERYDAIRLAGTGRIPLMPVLQGWSLDDYRRHLDDYGERIGRGAWVGMGSVCKRQGDPGEIVRLLAGVLRDRPDLRLHGFGVKRTALRHDEVRALLHSADSMAWSFAARFEGRDQNSWLEAARFALECGGCPEAVEILTEQRDRRRRGGRVSTPSPGRAPVPVDTVCSRPLETWI